VTLQRVALGYWEPCPVSPTKIRAFDHPVRLPLPTAKGISLGGVGTKPVRVRYGSKVVWYGPFSDHPPTTVDKIAEHVHKCFLDHDPRTHKQAPCPTQMVEGTPASFFTLQVISDCCSGLDEIELTARVLNWRAAVSCTSARTEKSLDEKLVLGQRRTFCGLGTATMNNEYEKTL